MSVQVESDAIIILSSTPDMNSPVIEISLDINGNAQHRITENGAIVDESSSPRVLSASEMRTFAISWHFGLVDVVPVPGDGFGLMSGFLQNQFNVKYVGVRTR